MYFNQHVKMLELIARDMNESVKKLNLNNCYLEGLLYLIDSLHNKPCYV